VATGPADAMPIGAVGCQWSMCFRPQLFPRQLLVVILHVTPLQSLFALQVMRQVVNATHKGVRTCPFAPPGTGCRHYSWQRGSGTPVCSYSDRQPAVFAAADRHPPVAGSGVGTVSFGEIALRAPGLGIRATLVHVGTGPGHTGRWCLCRSCTGRSEPSEQALIAQHTPSVQNPLWH